FNRKILVFNKMIRLLQRAGFSTCNLALRKIEPCCSCNFCNAFRNSARPGASPGETVRAELLSDVGRRSFPKSFPQSCHAEAIQQIFGRIHRLNKKGSPSFRRASQNQVTM
ncbi:MAG: hypothetical protein K2P46_05795, partial [Alistipes sp.]|nr:hypothetical protein [Alistipes sp.]